MEYLVYILNLRIQQSKHANDIYKKSIKLSLSLLGINVSYFIYYMIKSLFADIKFNVYGVFETSAIITFLLLVVSLSFEIYDSFINNSIKVEKWQYLLKHVTKLELKLTQRSLFNEASPLNCWSGDAFFVMAVVTR